jgi:beta-phosphoglucomutase family hydrolase/RpiB/LacA/LacB family sugar-phosphate isomerase
MRIVIGADHAGFPLKKALADYIRRIGHDVVDVGTFGGAPVDYPDYAEAVSKTLIDGKADRGVLICGSGVGASVAANKIPGIRAGLCHDTYSAHQGVEHDNMNVLVLGGRVIGPELARELITTYLRATFTRDERHQRRLEKISALEGRQSVPSSKPATLLRPLAVTRDRYEAVLFDMDGVITDTASIHASCWKTMFDEFLKKKAAQNGEPFRPFDIATDYKLYVDGKPRYHGVRDFLKSRAIVLPEGTPQDPPSAETVCGLGNRKNELVNERLASGGAEAYPGTVAFIMYLRRLGIKTAVVTSSQNCQAVLQAAKVEDLFDARVDGDVLVKYHLAGKPAPDSFLKAAEMLGVSPLRAVVVEDAISGVRAGAEGGFRLVIGVDRKRNAEELKAQGAHIVVNDLAELLSASLTRPLEPAA